MKTDNMVLADSYKRKIDYLRLSVTDRCNLRCKYCMPGGGIRLAGREELLTYEEILKVVKILGEQGIRKLRLTGGEPLLRDDILELVSGLSKLKDIEDISTELVARLKGGSEPYSVDLGILWGKKRLLDLGGCLEVTLHPFVGL